jgi:subtilisin-like proprotein convertase family protein
MTTPDCPGDAYFEMQIPDIVHQATGSPTLDLTISHPRTRELTVYLTSANGYVHTLWDRSTGTMPSTFTLTGMATDWVTGRYQLHVQDHEETRTGSVTSWCINAN